jgi:hypothetical protein
VVQLSGVSCGSVACETGGLVLDEFCGRLLQIPRGMVAPVLGPPSFGY